jgi:DNA-binding XRE family transcriptional regulator
VTARHAAFRGEAARDAARAHPTQQDPAEARRVLGARLRERRHEQRLTLRELGGRVGISAAAICDFELGKTWPKLETLSLLAGELDLSLDALFSDLRSSADA